MTNSGKYIAAIEICSSKIVGAVGRAKADGRLDVIAVEQERTLECVRHGVIHNVEETAHRVLRILDKLQSRPGVTPRKIKAVYVGLAGQSLRNITTEIDRRLPDETEITETILNSLKTDALSANIDSSLEVVDAMPRVYYVNKTETKSPVGTFGNNINATYDLIVCRPLLKKNLMRVVQDKAGMDIAGIVVTPLAVADMVLSLDEKRLGCMLVDMGAETTTVSIYRQGNLHYLATLPMGSRNITNDITSLSVLEERAEEIKTTSGNAIAQPNPSTLNLNGIKLSDVSNIVVARSEELVANIIEQISYAGITDKDLPGGIIVAGGGFNLNRLNELLKLKSGLSVRRASLPNSITLEDTKAPSYETIEVISILRTGIAADKPECLELSQPQELPVSDPDYHRPDKPEENPETPRAPKREPVEKEPNWLQRRLEKIKGRIVDAWKESPDDDTELD